MGGAAAAAAADDDDDDDDDHDDDEKRKESRMTKLLLKHRDEKGDGNIPIPVTITPDAVEVKFEGDVLLGGSYVKFPLDPVLPFMWGEKKDKFGSKKYVHCSYFKYCLLISLDLIFPIF